jgi:hypothetical protein
MLSNRVSHRAHLAFCGVALSGRLSVPPCCTGLETTVLMFADVHATSDGVILMFHDPTLDRTTTGKGTIRTQPYKGVIEYATQHPIS